MPGHGRATVDSHLACPVVATAREALAAHDFAPFRALNDMAWAMTAHIVYSAIDAARRHPVPGGHRRGDPPRDRFCRRTGLGRSLDAGAWRSIGERAAGALAAGCDVVLHCNGRLDEMRAVAAAVGPLGTTAAGRVTAGEACRRQSATPLDAPPMRRVSPPGSARPDPHSESLKCRRISRHALYRLDLGLAGDHRDHLPRGVARLHRPSLRRRYRLAPRRVSFNPLKHIDPFGTIVLPGLLLASGAPFLFGYAKPVPVNSVGCTTRAATWSGSPLPDRR